MVGSDIDIADEDGNILGSLRSPQDPQVDGLAQVGDGLLRQYLAGLACVKLNTKLNGILCIQQRGQNFGYIILRPLANNSIDFGKWGAVFGT